MLIAGCGAGLLNWKTVKVLQGTVSEHRAGMASGLARTTRFFGIMLAKQKHPSRKRTADTMTETVHNRAHRPHAVVTGDLAKGVGLTGWAGTSEFPVGGPDGRGGTASGADPYDLLSASLAACTAMTIRLQAQRRKYPLTRVEVAVSYHHMAGGGRDFFERVIVLSGALDHQQRSRLMQAANACPVGRTLGLSADIHTRENDAPAATNAQSAPADYYEDLRERSIVNIDPD